MIHFLDASALAKRYIAEPGSDDVLMYLRSGRSAAARLSSVEVASALARRCREGSVDRAAYDLAVAQLNADLEHMLVVEITRPVVHGAQALLGRHPLRAADALQLAAALELRRHVGGPSSFGCYDQRLRAAAQAEGLALFPA